MGNFTKQQQQAIDVRKRSAIVSAAAGSGKTRTLVERLFRILADPNPDTRVEADKVIIVTFTKDAAAEMKTRLNQAFSDAIDEMSRNGQFHENGYHWLIQQRTALGSAKISTIHAFCFGIIRENAAECGVSSQFSIAEPAREAIYKRRAIQAVLERWSREEHDSMEILFNFFCTRSDAELEKIIQAVAEYLSSLAFPEYWIQQALHLCEDEDDTLFEAIRKHFCDGVECCIAIAQTAHDAARNAFHTDDGVFSFDETLDSEILAMSEHLKYVRNADKATLIADPTVKMAVFGKLKPVRQTNPNLDAEQRDVLKYIRESYVKKYKSIFSNDLQPLRFYEEDREIQKQVIPPLLRITQEYTEALNEEKNRQNVLSFDDAERLVLHLLGEVDKDGRIQRTEFARSLAAQYAFIMVDEYQDSNDKQDCLFKLLSQDCHVSDDGQELYYGTNAFLVGDVKQAIYSFRQANPENFRKSIRNSTPLEDCKAQEMAAIYFNQNFRSANGIIEFINALFSRVMSETCGEIVYDAHEQLNFGAKQYQALPPEHQGVRIVIPQSGDTAPEDIQAECIADIIADMIARKVPVIDADENCRPCEYRDFSVLMRSVKKNSQRFSEAFRKRGIPFSCETEEGFLSLPEIRLIWNLLRVIDNPMTDVAMASVLLSPVCGFQPEDLAMLKSLNGGRKRLYLQIRNQSGENSPLGEKCRLFLEQLEQMRIRKDKMPLEEFIYDVYQTTDLLSLQSLYDNPDERRENLECFIRFAKDYREHADLKAQSCLSGWLRYLRHLSESEEKVTFHLNSQANYVTIQTIHKSKGLEKPFIFVAHLERPFHSRPKSAAVYPHQNGLLGLQMIDRKRCVKVTTAACQYIRQIRNQKEKSEEMRLLYVALTRAKQQLFLILNEIPPEKQNALRTMSGALAQDDTLMSLLVPEAGSMQEWLYQFLLSGSEVLYLLNAVENSASAQSPLASYIVWDARKPLQALPGEQQAETRIPPDEALLSSIQNQLNYHYQCSALPSKYTVTQLAHQEQELSEETPDFMLEDEQGRLRRLHGKARGTAIHKIMQFLRFDAALDDPEQISAQLEQMMLNGILTSVEKASVRPETLAAFFAGDLYHRIAAADKIEKEKQLFVKIGELNLPAQSALSRSYRDTDGILIGTADLLFHEPDGWVLVDYKTDRNLTGSQLLEKYSLQLGLYQKAMELILEEPVKQAYLYSFELNQALEVDLMHINYDEVNL